MSEVLSTTNLPAERTCDAMSRHPNVVRVEAAVTVPDRWIAYLDGYRKARVFPTKDLALVYARRLAQQARTRHLGMSLCLRSEKTESTPDVRSCL